MLDYIDQLFGADGTLSPHAYCLVRPELIWTHVVSDALIGAAYFSIPIALAVFLARRKDMVFGWMVTLFALFILACGTTHFFRIWTTWHADYGAEALLKALTAVVSVATAVALWPLLPRALALPSPAMLRRANAELQTRIVERDTALDALRRETEERRLAEDMLRQSQKLEAIGQLTGGIAHDFNNLLMIVGANLERARRLVADDPAEAHRSIGRAIEGADRAARLTSQLLTFARRTPLEAEVQSIAPVIERTAELMARTLGGVAVDVELPRDLQDVRIDAAQAEAALINLVVNARDAMANQPGRVRIAARNIPAEKGATGIVEITVSDTGTGMTDEVLARAFEPFFTTKPVGKGTGLGLSQVYGLVAQAGGVVTIDSQQGKGTTVRIRLPSAS